MATYSIGTYDFLFFDSQGAHFPKPTEDVELLARPGVDGLALWRTGKRGKPFQLVATVDQADLTTARTTLALYQDLIGADPVKIVWADIDLQATENLLFAVLDVQAIEGSPFQIATSSGGINLAAGDSGALLITGWTLVSLDTTSQPDIPIPS